jgi:hypothetical protein
MPLSLVHPTSVLFFMYITRAATCSSAPTSFTQHKRAFNLLHHAFNLYNVIWPESFCGPKIQHNAWKKKVAYTQLTDIMIIRNCPICRYDNSTDCVETAPKEWEFLQLYRLYVTTLMFWVVLFVSHKNITPYNSKCNQ